MRQRRRSRTLIVTAAVLVGITLALPMVGQPADDQTPSPSPLVLAPDPAWNSVDWALVNDPLFDRRAGHQLEGVAGVQA
jgi:hypothetical protein